MIDDLSTGYEGGEQSPSECRWSVEKTSRHYASGFTIIIKINDIPVGMVNVPFEEHIEWLKKLNGTQKLQQMPDSFPRPELPK